jgi:hypothetical protein
LGLVVSASLVGTLVREAKSVPEKVVSIGFQNYGNLILRKGRGELESVLAAHNSVGVE